MGANGSDPFPWLALMVVLVFIALMTLFVVVL